MAIEGVAAVYALFTIPTDPKNAWLLGYSFGRWGLVSICLLVTAICSYGFTRSFHQSNSLRNIFQILQDVISNTTYWVTLSMISLGGFSISLTILISSLTSEFNTSYIRTAPVISLVGLLFLQFGFLLAFLYLMDSGRAIINTFQISKGKSLLIRLFTLSLVIRVIVAIPVLANQTPPKYDEIGYFEMAIGIEQIISDISSGNTPTEEVTALTYNDGKWPPLHPIILGLSMFVFGNSVAAARFTVLILSALTTPLVYLLTSRISNERAGKTSALIHIFYPSFIAYSHYLWSETTYIFFILLAIYLITISVSKVEDYQRLVFLFVGAIILGISGLVRTTTLPFLFVILAWVSIALPKFERRIIYPIIVFTTCMFIWLPWLGYLQQKEGRFMPLATTGGFNLYLGNNPFESGDIREQVTQTMDLYAKGNFIDRDLAARTLAFQEIRSNPDDFLFDSIDRAANLWSPDAFLMRHILSLGYAPMAPAAALIIWPAVLLSYFGFVLISLFGIIQFSKNYPALIPIAVLVISGMALPMISISITRLHIPLLGLMLPAAGIGLNEILERRSKINLRLILILGFVLGMLLWRLLPNTFSFYKSSSYYSTLHNEISSITGEESTFYDTFKIKSNNISASTITIEITSTGFYFEKSQSQSIQLEFLPKNPEIVISIVNSSTYIPLELKLVSNSLNLMQTITPTNPINWLEWIPIEDTGFSIMWIGAE